MKLNKNSYDPILDSIADGVFTVDTDWRITSFNKAAEKITGVLRDEAVGSRCYEVFHAEICEQECLLKKTMKSGRPCVNKLVHIISRSGAQIPITVSTALLKDAAGAVIGGVETFRDLSEIVELRREVSGRNTHYEMITGDHRMLRILETVPVIAESESPVLILGESGTGKELMAKALHNLSGRKKGPFVAVNCGALPENLLESELFGYRKGAFTDAKTDKPGRFDRARGGTLFLDEVGDLPKSVQVKLLRVLQEGVYEPLGARASVVSDVRIIAATNRDLRALVDSGEFRRDLFYRIHVIGLTLPSLRDRHGDIAILCDHIVQHYNTVFSKRIEGISPEAMAVLLRHDFPGNIRELENILQHAFVLTAGSVIGIDQLPGYLFAAKVPPTADQVEWTPVEFERSRIVSALERNRHHRGKTASELGMHPATLWRKMKKYSLD